MANSMYTQGKANILAGNLDWDADTIKTTLCDAADYVKNLSTDDFYNDVTGAGRVATSSAMGSKTTTNGVADAADVTFSAVSGDVSEELVVWKDTTVESTSPLICNFDTATGLPVTPNGGDITVTWSGSGIFSI